MKTSLLCLTLLAAHASAENLFQDKVPGKSEGAYAYIGQESTAALPLKLTFAPDGGHTVANLSQGSALTVLLVDKQGHYLLKTPFGLTGWAQAHPEGSRTPVDPFANLVSLKNTSPRDAGLFYLFHIRYNPAHSKALDSLERQPGEQGEMIYHALITELAPNSGEYQVLCDEGMSADPGCGFVPVGQAYDSQKHTWLGGENFIIPGNGFVYSETDSNEYHTVRSKWAFKDGQLSQVEQPFFYIGETYDAENAFALEKLDGQGEIPVAAGEALTLILNALPLRSCAQAESCAEFVLLAQKADGQAGWLRIKDIYDNAAQDQPRLAEFRFHGD